MSGGETGMEPKTTRVSEDWLAVIVGLGLIALVWLGTITDVPWPLLGIFR